jgi:hypothetical protein
LGRGIVVLGAEIENPIGLYEFVAEIDLHARQGFLGAVIVEDAVGTDQH